MSFLRRFTYGVLLGVLFFFGCLVIGLAQGKPVATLSLIGTAIALEAQPAAVASLPLRFHPFSGALVSILGNLILIPILMLTFDEIVKRWAWIRRRLQKAEKWSNRYGKYGVWVLIVLTPIVGAYICIGIGYAMRWKPRLVFCSVIVGIVVSSFAITYGGESFVRLLRIHL